MITDKDYDNSRDVKDAAKILAQFEPDAAAFREGHAKKRLDIPYGDGPREYFDLFEPEGTPKGTLIYVHGGYWKQRDRSDFSHMAQGALARGYCVALPSYPLAPIVRISAVTQAVAMALQAIMRAAPAPYHAVGHSAGGHLVTRLLAPDSLLSSKEVASIASVTSISGVHDLTPLIPLAINAELRLDEDEAISESPIRQPAPETDVHIYVGGDELPAFLDQAQWLADAWPKAKLTVVNNKHHFDVIDALRDPNSDMLNAILGS